MESLNFKTVKTLAEGFTTKEVENVVNSWEKGTTNDDKVSFNMFSSLVRLGDTKEITVDVRLVVATKENLKVAVKNGEFREDIYHRLNEFEIELSPLRDKPEDINQFANHFLKLANQRLGKEIQGFESR